MKNMDTVNYWFWRNIVVVSIPLIALASFFHGCSDSGAPFAPESPEFSLDTTIDTMVDSLGDTIIDTIVDTIIDTMPDTTVDTTTSGITFNNFVGPLFVASCDGPGCHNSIPGVGNFSVVNYVEVVNGGSAGTGIVAGDTANSIVYQKLLNPPPFGSRMPLDGPPFFAQSTLDSIVMWILDGAPESP
jgi:hypothetical protein